MKTNQPHKKLFQLTVGTHFTYMKKNYKMIIPPKYTAVALQFRKLMVLDTITNKVFELPYLAKVTVVSENIENK